MPIMRAPVKGVAISVALADAYASAPDDLILLETIEMRHVSFLDENGKPFAIRLVNNNEDIYATVEDGAEGFESYSVTLNAPANCGLTPAVGVGITGLNPNKEYFITQPAGLAQSGWSAWPSGNLWQNVVYVAANGVQIDVYGDGIEYATKELARAAFGTWASANESPLTGYDNYQFWINDSNPGDNRGGLSLVVAESKTVRFRKCGFQFRRPKEGGGGEAGELQLQVDNVALYLMPYLLAAKGTRQPIYVTWRPYASTDLSGPHMLPVLTATMRNVKTSIHSVTGVASFSDATNLRFPTREYTGRLHPALTAR